VFPATLGYTLWDRGVRGGNLVLLAVASYFIPLAATLIIGVWLSVPIGAEVWLGCALVTAGALACKYSLD
jgi:drug/metabolite transporter (DMT)-like permease